MIINRIYEHQNLLTLQLVFFLVGLRTCQHICISGYGVADTYRPFEGACCLHLHDLTSRLPECEVEGTTILRNIGNCVPFDTSSLPGRLGSSAAPLQVPRISQHCVWVQRGRQETGHGVLRVDSSRPTKFQLRRTQVCFYATHRKVKIEHARRVLGNVVISLLDYTLHVRERCNYSQSASQNLKSRKVLKFRTVIKNHFWNQGSKTHSENLQQFLRITLTTGAVIST